MSYNGTRLEDVMISNHVYFWLQRIMSKTAKAHLTLKLSSGKYERNVIIPYHVRSKWFLCKGYTFFLHPKIQYIREFFEKLSIKFQNLIVKYWDIFVLFIWIQYTIVGEKDSWIVVACYAMCGTQVYDCQVYVVHQQKQTISAPKKRDGYHILTI